MSRQCQPCTACCDGWVQINVKGYQAYPGKRCPYSSEKGCRDYNNRPKNPCKTFECAWVKNDQLLPENLKPSESGALVLDHILTWQGLKVDLAVPVGREIPSHTLEWLMNHAEQTMRPLIYQKQPPEAKTFKKNPLTLAYGPPAFQQWVLVQVEQGTNLW